MAYIGNKPAEKYTTFSKQSITPDGSTTTFTLDHSVANENELEVFVDNVRQEPGSGKAYTASGTTLTMSEAVGSASAFYVLFQGKATGTVTPGDGTVTDTHLAGSITNAKLANSNITINGTSIALGASGTIVAGTDWQTVITADGSTATTAVAGKGYFIDNSSATHTINLPASPSIGDTVSIVSLGNANTYNITIGRNGSNIKGSASDYTFNTDNQSDVFVYSNATEGWVLQSSTSETPEYVTATGGTVTTSGNFKIHTFTGDGCFVVSSTGNTSGSTTIDYLIVAGGGGGGSDNGGGGGGGSAVTASNESVNAQTYPITIGAGGGAQPGGSCTPGSVGNTSSFYGITALEGGGGLTSCGTASPGSPFGNGGGGAGVSSNNTGGSGSANTPIPAGATTFGGNNGGNGTNGTCSVFRSGGGGGAGGAGNPGAPSPTYSKGGNGTPSDICGTTYIYGGGGGGGVYCNVGGAGGPGGSGGGGGGPTAPNAGGAAGPDGRNAGATGNSFPDGKGGNAGANTGSGGGGGGRAATNGGGSGGSGIVIIKYKYQN